MSQTAEEAFTNLENRLLAATIAWRNLDGGKTAKPNDELFFAYMGLDAVVDFVRAIPGWRERALPLERLLIALTQLQDGNSVEWLTPHRAPKRPRTSFDKRMLRGRCVEIANYIADRIGGHGKVAKADQLFLETASKEFIEQLLEKNDGAAASPRTSRVIERWRGQLNRSKLGSDEREGQRAAAAAIATSRDLLDSMSPEDAAKVLIYAMRDFPL